MDATNDPEGITPLDPNELDGLKFMHITTREQLNHLEQANIQSGLSWLERRRNTDILNERFVRDLHKHLFGEVWTWSGTFRTTEKNIGIDPIQIGVQLRILLDDVRYWIENDTYAPVEMALRFHHRLVYIHLFPNGNGRHARIMADILLVQMLKKPPIDWTGGHNLRAMTERRQQYIRALKAADQGDYRPLLGFVKDDKMEC